MATSLMIYLHKRVSKFEVWISCMASASPAAYWSNWIYTAEIRIFFVREILIGWSYYVKFAPYPFKFKFLGSGCFSIKRLYVGRAHRPTSYSITNWFTGTGATSSTFNIFIHPQFHQTDYESFEPHDFFRSCRLLEFLNIIHIS